MLKLFKRAAKVLGALLLVWVGSVGALVALTLISYSVTVAGFFYRSQFVSIAGILFTAFFSLGLYGLTMPADVLLGTAPRVHEAVLRQVRPFVRIVTWAIAWTAFAIRTRLWEFGGWAAWIAGLFGVLLLGSLGAGKMERFRRIEEAALDKGWYALAGSLIIVLVISVVPQPVRRILSAFGQRADERAAATEYEILHPPVAWVLYDSEASYLKLVRFDKSTRAPLMVVGCDDSNGLPHLYYIHQNVEYDPNCAVPYKTRSLDNHEGERIVQALRLFQERRQREAEEREKAKLEESATTPIPVPEPAPAPPAMEIAQSVSEEAAPTPNLPPVIRVGPDGIDYCNRSDARWDVSWQDRCDAQERGIILEPRPIDFCDRSDPRWTREWQRQCDIAQMEKTVRNMPVEEPPSPEGAPSVPEGTPIELLPVGTPLHITELRISDEREFRDVVLARLSRVDHNGRTVITDGSLAVGTITGRTSDRESLVGFEFELAVVAVAGRDRQISTTRTRVRVQGRNWLKTFLPSLMAEVAARHVENDTLRWSVRVTGATAGYLWGRGRKIPIKENDKVMVVLRAPLEASGS